MLTEQSQGVERERQTRLTLALREIIRLEHSLNATASDVLTKIAGDTEAQRFVEDLMASSTRHADALARRLSEIGNPEQSRPDRLFGAPAIPTSVATGAASEALQRLYVALHTTIAGYITVQTASHRFRESWRIARDGTLAHLGRRHIQEYLAISARIPALLAQVVLDELDAEHLWCDCDCPACGSGLCLCGATAEAIWREAWTGAEKGLHETEGVAFPSPRPGSAAATAGIQKGDVLEALAGILADSIATVQTTLSSHPPGTAVGVVLLRGAEQMKLKMVRPDSGEEADAEHAGDDCLQPSGQAFYLDRARDLQRQLRRGGQPVVPHPDGIAGLTARELQVLRLVADGATNAMIARKLRIQLPTVKRHVSSIIDKLGVGNRAQAAAIAAASGLTSEP